MRTSISSAAIIGVLFFAGCADGGNRWDKVNGSVSVPPGAQVGNASTVNGSIVIGHDATIRGALTVNGGIELGEHAKADSLKSVNGGIQIGAGAQVAHTVTTVNGGLHLAPESQVGGKLENVNGQIDVDHAKIEGGIATTTGDVTIRTGSVVHGGLHVEKQSGAFSHITRNPRIVIASGAVVDGPLQFDRAVDLLVAPDAKIGKVTGATVQPYTGQ